MSALLEVVTVVERQRLADLTPYYCRRCPNPKPLGMLAPGRFWSRQNGRTLIMEGGKVRVWCERCSKEHTILLDSK